MALLRLAITEHFLSQVSLKYYVIVCFFLLLQLTYQSNPFWMTILYIIILTTSQSRYLLKLTSSYTARLFEGKMNNKIDLDSPKVATIEKMQEGDKKVYCRCWKSETFPLCDGSHMAHNKETGDNVGPLILSAAATTKSDDVSTANDSVAEEKTSIIGKFKSLFKREKNDDGLTTKERLAKMGLSVLLSYGWVSNMSYSVTLSLAWYGFSKKVSLCICYT